MEAGSIVSVPGSQSVDLGFTVKVRNTNEVLGQEGRGEEGE